MSAADKFAFLQLWELSNCGREKICITAVQVAKFQGVSSDAGKDRLENLKARGLIHVVDKQRSGVWTITLADPRDVATIRGVPWDGQLELPFTEETSTVACGTESVQLRAFAADVFADGTEDPPEEPPEDPPTAHFKTPSRDNISNTPSTFTLSAKSFSIRETPPPGGTSGGTSAAISSRGAPSPGGPTHIGSALVAALERRLPSRADQEREALRIATMIKDRVDCPNQYFSPCKRVAWAIVEGRIKQADVEDLLDRLDRVRRTLSIPASAYFAGGVKRIYARAGEPLPKRKDQP